MATQVEVAKHLFISDKWVRELIKKGVLPSSNARGGLDIDECRKAFIKYLQGVNSGQIETELPKESLEERAQKLKLKREETALRKQNYQLSVLEKAYAPISIIRDTLLGVTRSLSITLESFTGKIKKVWKDMPPEAKVEIDKIIAELANELANTEPDFSEYEESDIAGSEDWLESIDDE